MDELIQKLANGISKHNNKMIIGISGHGASGKTTIAEKLRKALAPDEVNYINTDPYIIGSSLRKYAKIGYQYHNEEHFYKMTACHPAAHNIAGLERDIQMIRDGFDIKTIDTSYMPSKLISSQNRVSIVEGMSVAFTKPELYDLTIYLYTNGDTEFSRRSVRDISERGMDINYLKQSHEERRIQYELFMHPYHQNFDIVIKNDDEGFYLEKGDFN
jgi:uridine kinase